jgi:peroxiredoxin
MSARHGGRVANAAVGTDAVGELAVGGQVPDFELLDHSANRRRLTQLVGGDPTVLHFYRGWWCPKEQAFFRRLLALQEDAEVAYSRMVSVSIDPPQVNAAFRAGLGARWTFLSDPDCHVQNAALTPRDHRHAQRPVRAGRGRDQPGPPHSRCIQRLLVLGATHPRRTRKTPARHQP